MAMSGSGSGGGRVDVNRAGAAELERALVGIGRRRARGIVRKREVSDRRAARGGGGSSGAGVPRTPA